MPKGKVYAKSPLMSFGDEMSSEKQPNSGSTKDLTYGTIWNIAVTMNAGLTKLDQIVSNTSHSLKTQIFNCITMLSPQT